MVGAIRNQATAVEFLTLKVTRRQSHQHSQISQSGSVTGAPAMEFSSARPPDSASRTRRPAAFEAVDGRCLFERIDQVLYETSPSRTCWINTGCSPALQ